MDGEQFGPYRLLETIGRGGMGEVYRAYDTQKCRTVALKRLPVLLAGDHEFRTRFRREAEIVARLREPHVIPIHDYGEIDGQFFIDMRLLEGTDLAALIARTGPLPAGRAVPIVTQVAAALAAAHAQGIVHRDVKASNVLISRPPGDSGQDDFVYLVDFGIARHDLATSLTTAGRPVGTLAYMAPEQFVGGPIDARVDVYALGCLLYEALTGGRPFREEGLAALMYAHLNSPPPRASDQVGVTPALDAVIIRAMAKDPGDRYAGAIELASAARSALAEPGTAPRAPVGSRTPASSRLAGRSREPGAGERRGSTRPVTRPDPARGGAGRSGRTAAVVLGGLALVSLVAVAVTAIDESTGPAAASPGVNARQVGKQPRGVAVAGNGRLVYVSNSGSNSVSVLDAATREVVTTIPVGSSPDAVASGGETAIVGNHAGGSVSVIDSGRSAVTATVSLPAAPDGVAITPDGHRGYVASSAGGSVFVIGTDAGTDTGSSTVRTSIAVPEGPVGLTLTPDGRRAYVTTRSNSLVVIDTATNAVTAIPIGAPSNAIAITPDGTRCYVTTARNVVVIDTAHNTVTATIQVGPEPAAVAIAPDGAHAYVTSAGSGSLSFVDAATNTVTRSAPAGATPAGLAISGDGRWAYVADSGSDAVAIIDTSGTR